MTNSRPGIRFVRPASFALVLFIFTQAGVSSAVGQSGGSTGCALCGLTDYSAADCGCGVEDCSLGCGACRECLACREHLFGDWLGARSGLAERGIVIDLPLTQFYQGVTSGGVRRDAKYGGKLDYLVNVGGAKLGLNEGFSMMIHAETRFGESVNHDAGVLAFPNANMLYPLPGENETAVTGFLLMQALNEKVVLVGGKFNGLDLFNMIYPNTGRGIDGFMNLSFLIPKTLLRTTGLSFNGAGVLGMKGKQVQSGVLVYDTQSTSTTVAPDLFGQGAVVLGYHRFFTEFGGLPGSHGFLANYSNRTYASTDPLDWIQIPGEGLAAIEKSGSWSVGYFLDQILWQDCCDDRRNLRLFSSWGIADKNPNPYRWSGNIQLQGSGLICGREDDRMGAGYFYDGLNSNFKNLVSAAPNFDLQDIQGFEFYYNAAITPWFHLTGDLQVVENQNRADNTAVILGLRATIDL